MDMCIRGRDYREDYDFEMMGEDVTASLAPLADEHFLPIAAFLREHLGMDEEEAVEAVEEAKEEAEEEGEESIDITKMDTEFVFTMQRAAIKGLKGSYDGEGEYVEHTEEEAETMVKMMVGGYSVEIGGKVLEISGDVRDATKFRGSRGSI
ncbi:hypothetical protein HSR121_2073 [Halapricum desulfuricans]|uniref:Uncharacterized protein n=2 Tax=Halapricum desulfuricans TaxID=2841257 RepID=A0A897N5Y0_9EURY|nr:hypothetical protein HSR121_2073 [Halapricum desulfuricans]